MFTEQALAVAVYLQESANVNVRFAVYPADTPASCPLAICVLLVESGAELPQLKDPPPPTEPELHATVIAERGTFGQLARVPELLLTCNVHVFEVLPRAVFHVTVTPDPVGSEIYAAGEGGHRHARTAGRHCGGHAPLRPACRMNDLATAEAAVGGCALHHTSGRRRRQPGTGRDCRSSSTRCRHRGK